MLRYFYRILKWILFVLLILIDSRENHTISKTNLTRQNFEQSETVDSRVTLQGEAGAKERGRERVKGNPCASLISGM